jgi:tetratricopeptide (TPR) repeat protein
VIATGATFSRERSSEAVIAFPCALWSSLVRAFSTLTGVVCFISCLVVDPPPCGAEEATAATAQASSTINNNKQETVTGDNIISGRDTFIQKFTANLSLEDYMRSLIAALDFIDKEITKAEPADDIRSELMARRKGIIQKIADPVTSYKEIIAISASSAERIGKISGLPRDVVEPAQQELAKNNSHPAQELLEAELGRRRDSAARAATDVAESAFALGQLKEASNLDFVGAAKLYEEAVRATPKNPTYLSALAQIEVITGNFRAAETHLRDLIQLHEKTSHTVTPDFLITKQILGNLYWQIGEFGNSKKELQSALGASQSLGKSSELLTTRIEDQLGLLLWKEGNFQSAEATLRAALSGIGKDESPDIKLTKAGVENSLASLLTEMNVFVEAEHLFQEALSLENEVQTPYSKIRITNILNNQATLVRKIGVLATAAAMSSAVIYTYRTLLGDLSPFLATGKTNFGIILCDSGDFDKSDEYLNESLLDRKRLFGESNRVVAETLSALGNLRLRQNKLDDARKYHEEAYAIRAAVLDPRHLYIAKSLDSLGYLSLSEGNVEKATDSFQRSLSILDNIEGANQIYTPIVLEHLEIALEKQGDRHRVDEINKRRLTLSPLKADCGY